MLNTFEKRTSVVMNESKPTWLAGANGKGKPLRTVAPSAFNWASVKRPADTKALPAGVNAPEATVLLKLRIRAFSAAPSFTSLPNEPRFVPGSGSWVTPSPSKSEKKISEAPKLAPSRKIDWDKGELIRVVVFSLNPQGKSVSNPKLSWCLRSKPAGPKNFVGASL